MKSGKVNAEADHIYAINGVLDRPYVKNVAIRMLRRPPWLSFDFLRRIIHFYSFLQGGIRIARKKRGGEPVLVHPLISLVAGRGFEPLTFGL
jgi:hypothetical protein